MGDLPDNDTTEAILTLDADYVGQLENTGDRDWVRIDLEAGQWVQVAQRGTGDRPLYDPFVRIHNAEGHLVTTDDEITTSSSNLDAAATFGGGSTAATYYVEAGAYRDAYDGGYTLSAQVIAPPLGNPVDALDSGSRRTDRDISVYLVGAGERASFGYSTNGTQDDIVSEGWNAYESARIEAALGSISAVTGLNFTFTTNRNADFQLVLDTNELNNSGLLGYFYYPSGTRASVGVFNGSGVGWDDTAGGGLERGGISYATLVHEFLHGLGLAHPHDGSRVMQGVNISTGDHGVNGLNQGIYSTMSYNGGYANATTASYDTGNEAGPMAFDIAALQEIYGANMTTASGDDVYILPETEDLFWQSIWDTGGYDTIRYDGELDSVIDLRAATLTYDIGGGGFVSAANGVAGGFTIAHGVAIEAAIGGSGNDQLVANDAGNSLNGGAGIDVLRGGAGADMLIGGLHDDIINGAGGADTIIAGDGDDVSNGGVGNDDIDGGAGNDTVTGGSGADHISATAGQNLLEGGSGQDRIIGGDDADIIRGGGGADTLFGGLGDDSLTGGRGADQINGGGGNDRIEGGLGADALSGQMGADSFVFHFLSDSGVDAAHRDQVLDFEIGIDQIDLSGIDANQAAVGDQAFVFRGQDTFNGAGQVRAELVETDTVLQIDRDGDGMADMAILLVGTTSLTASDFIL